MPKSTKNYVSKDLLINASLPQATKTYTVISHGHVINKTLDLLNQAGFTVEKEIYRCNMDARVAQGIYKINYSNDTDLSMMFTWTNSYDKSTRFRCAIGAYVNASGVSMVKKTSSWQRKHTGAALQETDDTIKNIIDDADVYFKELVDIKNKMKSICISDDTADNKVKRKFSHILADLAFYKKLLNSNQVSTILKESESPSFQYSTDANSLWTAYNYILCGVRIAHPKLWLDNQTSVLLHFMDEYDLVTFDDDEDEEIDVTDFSIQLPDHTNEAITDSTEESEEENKAEEEFVVPEVVIQKEPVTFTTDEEEDEMMEKLFKPISDNVNVVENTDDDNTSIINNFDLDPQDNVEEEPQEDLQNIPVDNVVEQVVEKSADNTIFLMQDDYPEAKVGEYIQVEEIIYQVKSFSTIDSVTYIEAVEYVMDVATANTTAEPVVNNTQPDLFSTALPGSDFDADGNNAEVEDVIENDAEKDVFDLLGEATEDEAEEPEDNKNQAVKDAISKELIDLYGFSEGYNFDFTYELTDSQYNITLDSGESLVLSSNYIEGLMGL